MILILGSELAYAKDDLKERLKTVPNGTARMNMLLGNCTSLFKDILGTITDKQRKTLRNSAQDYEIRLTPKLSPESSSLAVSKKDLTVLINCARERCKFCVLDGKQCKFCELYKILEIVTPLDDYGDGIACPYAYSEWQN